MTTFVRPAADIAPFDLQARAELAIHGLTALLDPERPGVMYFLANWRSRPPRADHGLWDCGDGSGRHIDALTLARSMVRSDSPAAELGPGEAQLEAWMLRLLGDEGLSWLLPEPFAAPWGREWLLARESIPQQVASDADRYAEVSWAQRGTLMGLLSRFLSTSDQRYLDLAHSMVDGLLRVAVGHPDGLYFPEGYYRQNGWQTKEIGLHPGIEENNVVVAVPALRLFEVSGHVPALELGEGLIRFALKHSEGYAPDGRLCAVREDALQSHFHTRSAFVLRSCEQRPGRP